MTIWSFLREYKNYHQVDHSIHLKHSNQFLNIVTIMNMGTYAESIFVPSRKEGMQANPSARSSFLVKEFFFLCPRGYCFSAENHSATTRCEGGGGGFAGLP
jgi:hypothetical protein